MNSNDYTPDPAHETEIIIDAFFTELIAAHAALEGAGKTQVRFERDALRARSAELEAEHAARAGDELSRHNLRYACAVLAGFEALCERGLAAAEAVAALREAFHRSGAGVREKVRFALDQSPDPFRDLVAVSKRREAAEFGRSFAFERSHDTRPRRHALPISLLPHVVNPEGGIPAAGVIPAGRPR